MHMSVNQHGIRVAGVLLVLLVALLAEGRLAPRVATADSACPTPSYNAATHTYTVDVTGGGAECTWTVPADVTSATITAVGASGGSEGENNIVIGSSDNPGGAGAAATATFPVTSGQTYFIVAGGAGGTGGSVTQSNSTTCPTAGTAGVGGVSGSYPGGAGGKGYQFCTNAGGLIVGDWSAGGGGGGGGSFVYSGTDDSGTVLMAAGGGGGGGEVPGDDAPTTFAAGPCTPSSMSGDTGWNGTGYVDLSDSLNDVAGSGGGGSGCSGGAGGTFTLPGNGTITPHAAEGGTSYIASSATNTSISGASQAGGDVKITYETAFAPSFTGSNTSYAEVQTPFEFEITTDANPPATISVADGSSLPAWLSLTATCGADTAPAGAMYLCGTPPLAEDGNADIFTLQAENVFDGSTHAVTQDFTVYVDPADTYVTLAGPGGATYEYDAAYSEHVVITATVTVGDALGPSLTQDEGSVLFCKYNSSTGQCDSISSSCDNVPVSGSQATCTLPQDETMTVGDEDEFYAYYLGGDDYYESDTGYLQVYVDSASTSASVISSAASTPYSSPPTLTATVTSSLPATINPGTGDGTVEFDAGGTPIAGCETVPLMSGTNSGTAQCTPAAGAFTVAGSPYSITATFHGATDGNYADSDPSAAISQEVTQAASDTSLQSDTPSPVDASTGPVKVTYTATATVSGTTTGLQDGAISFTDGTTTICAAAPVDSNGQVTCFVTYTASDGGSHSIQAHYSAGPTGNYAASDSSVLTMGVAASPAFTSDASASGTVGQAFSFTVKTSGFPVPSVSLSDSSQGLPADLHLSGNGDGTATISGIPALGSVATYTLNFQAENSFGGTNHPTTQTFTLTINPAPTTTALQATASPVYGEAMTLTATVSPPSNSTPATVGEGTVSFSQGATPISACSGVNAPAVSNGTAACTLPAGALGEGSYSFTAAYAGTQSYAGSSTTESLQVTVAAASTSTSLNSSANPAVYGQLVNFTASVSAVSPSTLNPTDQGTVTFYNDATVLCAHVSLSNGQAVCAVAAGTFASSDAPYSITAVFTSTTENFTGSTSAAVAQQVNQAATTTTLTTNGNPALVGQKVTLSATVIANQPSVIDPGDQGSVTFMDGGATLCNGPVALSGGVATCTVTFPSYGAHLLTAAYSGAANYAGSSSTLSEAVQAETTTSASATFFSFSTGAMVAITARVRITAGELVGTGSVTFTSGGTTLCTVPLKRGKAICEVPAAPETTGPHNITAAYTGSGAFLPSSSTTDAVPTLARPTLVSIKNVAFGQATGWVVQGGGFSGARAVTVCGQSAPFTVVNDNVLLVGRPGFNSGQRCTMTVTASGGTGSAAIP